MQVRLKSDALEAELIRRGWTHADLASKIHTSRPYISDLIAHRNRPGHSIRKRLLATLGKRFDDLFETVSDKELTRS